MQLLDLLQSGRSWSGAELCERLEVSPRTLRRDVDDLRAQGYGVLAAPGVGGGYRIGPGAAIPPLALSDDEAVAIAVGLRAAAFSVVTGVEDASLRALTKLEQSLSAAARERIARIETAIVPLAVNGRDAVDMAVLSAVALAIRASRELHVHYRRHDGETRTRVLHPHRIVRTASRWYLLTRYLDDPTWRTLRLDRLEPMLPLGPTFERAIIDDDEVRRLTNRAIAVEPYPVRIRARFAAPAAVVAQHFGPAVAEVVDLGDGTAELLTGGPSLEVLDAHLTASGLPWELLEGSAGERGQPASAASTRSIAPPSP